VALHPAWTHGSLVQRILSGIVRAELVRHGFAVFGRSPGDVLPAMSDPVMADLGLTSMARGRHTLVTGELLTKTQAIEQADAPDWLIDQLRVRRRGENVTSPRVRTALIAWRDARRTVVRAGS